MNSLIPELDRVCQECGCTELTCVSTTATTWLGHCPHCGWQGWQDLPPAPELAAKQSRPVARHAPDPLRFDPKRVPILHRTVRTRANKNLPSGETLPGRPAPNPGVLFGGRALAGYGPHGIGPERPRPWPRWCSVFAPIALTASLLGVVLYAVLTGAGITHTAPCSYNAAQQVTQTYTRVCGHNTLGFWDCVDQATYQDGRYCGTNRTGHEECVIAWQGD